MSRSFLIGVLTYGINTSFIPEILEGCEDFFLTNNYGMLLATYHNNHEFVDRVEILRRRGVDGLLVISGANAELASQLAPFADMPKVCIGTRLEAHNSAYVKSDGAATARIAASELLQRGHRQIGYLTNQDNDRVNAWQAVFADAKVTLDPGWIVHAHNWFEEGCEAAEQLLRKHPEITAIFADSDILAAAAQKAATKLGLNMPDQLSIIGTDDTPICRMTTPELASISFPKREHGIQAARLLDLLLNGKTAENILLPVKLVPRASLATLDHRKTQPA